MRHAYTVTLTPIESISQPRFVELIAFTASVVAFSTNAGIWRSTNSQKRSNIFSRHIRCP